MEWWLLEQRINTATTEVKTALEQLVAEELVIPREGHTGQVSYRVNRGKKTRDSTATGARGQRGKTDEQFRRFMRTCGNSQDLTQNHYLILGNCFEMKKRER